MQLQNAFLTILIFCYFNIFKFLKTEMNILTKIIKVIFYQFDEESYQYLTIYFSKKIVLTKCNYEIHDKELLRIMRTFKKINIIRTSSNSNRTSFLNLRRNFDLLRPTPNAISS